MFKTETELKLELFPRNWTETETENYVRNWNITGSIAMYKVNDLEFQGHVIEMENFNYHHWIPWSRNYTHEKFHKKIGKTKIQGVASTPLGCKR